MISMTYDIQPATHERWDDVVALFGERGGTEGCWCMYWRVSETAFQAHRGEANKLGLKELTCSQFPPGLLAYAGKQPVGWCGLGPREHFARLQRSVTLKPIDNTPVWSIVCFFIHRHWRNKGVASALVAAAIDFARQHGAKVIEGYPIEGKVGNGDAYTGVPVMYSRLGFQVAIQRGKRSIMRLALA